MERESSLRLHSFIAPRAPGWVSVVMMPASSSVLTASAVVLIGISSVSASSPTFMLRLPSACMMRMRTGEASACANR